MFTWGLRPSILRFCSITCRGLESRGEGLNEMQEVKEWKLCWCRGGGRRAGECFHSDKVNLSEIVTNWIWSERRTVPGERRRWTQDLQPALLPLRDCHLFGRNSYQSMNSRFLAGIAEHTLGKVRRMVWIWLTLLLTKSLSHITLHRMVIILLFANKLTPISTLSLLAALSSKLQIYSTNKSNIKYSNNMVKNSVTFHQVIQLSIYAVDFVLRSSRR